MPKMLTAYTSELDDPELAVEEILEQLNAQGGCLAHSVGIVNCYTDYVDSGVFALLKEALPFEIVGCTTMLGGNNSEGGPLLLNLAVLTGEDVSFSVASGAIHTREDREKAADAYREAAARLTGEPALALVFLPPHAAASGESIFRAIEGASGSLPIFGTVASDYRPGFVNSEVIAGAEHGKDIYAMVLVQGNIDPSFVVMHVSEDKLQKQRAVITESTDNILISINGMRSLDYMRTIGISRGDGLEGVAAVPLLIDYGDGSKPVIRDITGATEEGYLVCAGTVRKGASFAIGAVDGPDIIAISRQAARRVLEANKRSGALIFPCISRALALGMDVAAEMEGVREVLGDSLPYIVGYSGGEVCPVATDSGGLANRFHNFSFVACVF